MVHWSAAPGRIKKILWGTGKSEEKSNKDSDGLGGGYEEWLKDLNSPLEESPREIPLALLTSFSPSPSHHNLLLTPPSVFCFTRPFPPLKPSFNEEDAMLSPSNKGSLPPVLSYGRGQSLPPSRLLNCGYSSQLSVPLHLSSDISTTSQHPPSLWSCSTLFWLSSSNLLNSPPLIQLLLLL